MASFSAELQVAGQRYPVRHCAYAFAQATDVRGRVRSKVRPGLVRLTLDVPDDGVLLDWAATIHKPLAGRVVFFDGQGGQALETLAWAAGECVGYREVFVAGSAGAGAYVCHLAIAAPQLTLHPGGPAAYLRPAPRDHGTPPLGLLNVPPVVVPPVVTPLIVPVVEGLEALAARLLLEGLAAAAGPAALTLALILASTTPAHAPGLPHPPPPDRDTLRLHELAARYAAGTLVPGEEAELIALLAKVKGIHVNSLADLADPTALNLPMRGGQVPLRNFTILRNFAYTKRDPAAKNALRRKFDSSGRAAFLKHLAGDQKKLDRMRKLGLDDSDLARIKAGKCPKGYQVHHKLSLDDGGDNQFNNLVLIKDEPYHRAVTVFQNSSTITLQPGQTQVLDWPIVNDYFYPNF